ncbi:hypothetical protein GCM10010221_39210 [Streptomyces parvus]|nr:hypothetical protein GCM10010221_39210 [Streptomyces parvus]
MQGELGRPEHQDHDVEAPPPAAEEQGALNGQGEEQEREHPRAGQMSTRRDMARGTEDQARRTAEQAPGRSPRQAARCTHGHKVATSPGGLGGGYGVRFGAAVSSHGAVVGRMAEKVPTPVRFRIRACGVGRRMSYPEGGTLWRRPQRTPTPCPRRGGFSVP